MADSEGNDVGARGPKPKPTALRVFEGTRQKAGSKNEIQPSKLSKAPAAPSWLGDHGKAEWNYVAPLLWATNCLTEIDISMLSQYCSAWDDFHAAIRCIESEGLISVGHNGNDIANPAIRIKHSAMKLIQSIAAQFGLNPTSRVGMNAPTQDEGHDDLESFKAG